MAEALGFLASIAGVAGAGVGLATTLYQFAEAIGNAGFEVLIFASGVIMISRMLTGLRESLKNSGNPSDQILSTAQEIVSLCDAIAKLGLSPINIILPLASVNLAINQNVLELNQIYHAQTQISLATVKDNMRRTSKPMQILVSASESIPLENVHQFVEKEALHKELPNLANECSNDEEETLYSDEHSVTQLEGFDTSLLEGLPSLDDAIYDRLVSVQEKVIEVAEEVIERSNTGYTLQVANAAPPTPLIKLDNPSGSTLTFRTQWMVTFCCHTNPASHGRDLNISFLEIYKDLDNKSFESLPLSKLGKGNARQAVYQAIQDSAFLIFAISDHVNMIHAILKYLWETTVAPNGVYGLRFRQADLNHD